MQTITESSHRHRPVWVLPLADVKWAVLLRARCMLNTAELSRVTPTMVRPIMSDRVMPFACISKSGSALAAPARANATQAMETSFAKKDMINTQRTHC